MNPTPHAKLFEELAIANLGSFLILVPTTMLYSPDRRSALGLPLGERLYSGSGWAFDTNSEQIGTIQGLHLEPIFPDSSPFKVRKRLAQGIPLSFELSSLRTVSDAIAQQARFWYQFQDYSGHHGVFHGLKPRFVRVYPFRSTGQFPQQVAHCIEDEWQVRFNQHLYLESESNPT